MTYDDYLEASIKRHTDAPIYAWYDAYQELRLHFTYPRYIPVNVASKKDAIQALEELKEEIEMTINRINDVDEWEYV